MTRRQAFSRQPSSVGAARRFVKQALASLPRDEQDAVELMVSELATNCIRHTDVPFELTVSEEGTRVRVAVTDRAEGNPRMRSPAPTETSGRGLQIVNMLARSWGVDHERAGGKTVWFTL